MVFWDHILIGTAIGLSNPSQEPVIIAASIGGSLLPDIDLLYGRPGSIKYLSAHRRFTHSLFLLPIYSFVLAFLISIVSPNINIEALFIWTSIGFVLHLLVDILNSYGTSMWYPFNKKKVSLDLIFDFDFAFSLILLFIITIQIIAINNSESNLVLITIAASSLLIVYIISRIISRNKFINTVKEYSASINNKIIKASYVPASYWRWKGILVVEEEYIIFRTRNRKLEVEHRKIIDIPHKYKIGPVRRYIEYARHLDVVEIDDGLSMSNLIYPSSTYKMIIVFNSTGDYKFNIEFPSLSPSEY